MKMNATTNETGFSRSKFTLFARAQSADNASNAALFQANVRDLMALRDAVRNPAQENAFSAA